MRGFIVRDGLPLQTFRWATAARWSGGSPSTCTRSQPLPLRLRSHNRTLTVKWWRSSSENNQTRTVWPNFPASTCNLLSLTHTQRGTYVCICILTYVYINITHTHLVHFISFPCLHFFFWFCVFLPTYGRHYWNLKNVIVRSNIYFFIFLKGHWSFFIVFNLNAALKVNSIWS